MPTVIIDATEYTVPDGLNMLEAVLSVGLDLPYFCWHPAMRSVGACRQCAVRVFRDEHDTKGRIVMACMTPATDGTRISISDPEANELRRYVIEWLMTNHPHDCPVCDEGGECHLQDMTVMVGQIYRRFRGRKRTYNNQNLGPFVNHEMNRCIQCWRCVRFYRDLAGGRDFSVFGSKNRVYFGRHKDGALESEFSGNLVEVCPTGVFTDKTLKRHYTRKWDMENAPSVCVHCGLGCNTIPGARYGMLRRIRARYNPEVNGYFLCDRGRYGYEFVNGEKRIRDARGADAAALLKNAKGIIGIGSPRASLESSFALRKLVGGGNFSTGLSAFDQSGAVLTLELARRFRSPSLSEIASSDAILVLGADPTNEAPMLDFAIRQAVKSSRLDISRELHIPDWDANAVAEALQGAKGHLFVANPWRTKLMDIAEEAQIAGYATLRQAQGHGIVKALSEAQRPVIVTSISAGTEVLSAAAELASTIRNCGLSIIVPEANTMGVAMLAGMSVDEAVSRIESGEADTLVVLENDLSRRMSSERMKALREKCQTIIALDCVETAVTDIADIVIPTSSWVESTGTFVNNECRVQRFFQVFVPDGEMKPAWQVVKELFDRKDWSGYESLLNAMAAEEPSFAGAVEAAPPADWRSPDGQKVPRQSHRFTGRTAMNANWTLDEPRPSEDPDTPFVFSMEGERSRVPGSLTPRFWWPGWNSSNAVTKFQTTVNGDLIGGNIGRKLIEPDAAITPSPATAGEGWGEGLLPSPSPAAVGEGWGEGLLLILRPQIHGSEELSSLAPGVAEMSPRIEATVHTETASSMGITDGDTCDIETAEGTLTLTVRVDEKVAPGVVIVPAGYPETAGITKPQAAKIVRSQ